MKKPIFIIIALHITTAYALDEGSSSHQWQKPSCDKTDSKLITKECKEYEEQENIDNKDTNTDSVSYQWNGAMKKFCYFNSKGEVTTCP